LQNNIISNKLTYMLKFIFAFSVFYLLPFFSSTQIKYSKKLDQYTTAYAAVYDFHGAVLIAKKNEIIFQKAFGYANREWSVKNTTDTRFPIASLTKQFTAAAILQLAEQGKLSVDDRLSKFFPGYPQGDSVTIHMLLNHTSGIKEYSQVPELFQLQHTDKLSKDTIIKLFQKLPFNFSPGTFWGYSNTGYILLGYIIEQVTGETYGDYIQNEIFQKTGMSNSGLYRQDAVTSKRAFGYTQTPTGIITQMVVPFKFGFSDGGLFSTVEDLLVWANALRSCKIIGKEYLSKMNQPNREEGGAGYGIFIDNMFDRKVRFHTGNIPGYSSIMLNYVEEDVTIVILANRETNLDFFPKGIAAIMFDKEVVIPHPHKPIQIPSESLRMYTGKFEAAFPFEVLEKNGKLFMNLGRDIELLAESKTKVYVAEPDVDIQLEYVFNEKNKIVRLFYIEGGVKTEVKLK
jgi:CubicO group peptidase (beta-lactamase class C family)